MSPHRHSPCFIVIKREGRAEEEEQKGESGKEGGGQGDEGMHSLALCVLVWIHHTKFGVQDGQACKDRVKNPENVNAGLGMHEKCFY